MDGLRLVLDPDPPATFRAELAKQINAFHAKTVPGQSTRFGLRLEAEDGQLAGGISATLFWGWMFVEAVWVDERMRGKGAGKAMLLRAEDHARESGCHSVWLETFQASGFYEALGYTVFGTLEDYPPGQARTFFRKRLTG